MVRPAQIADVLPRVNWPLTYWPLMGSKRLYWAHQPAGAEAELLEILGRPPVAHHAVTVGFGP